MSVLVSVELAGFPSLPAVGDTVFNTALDGLYVYAPGATGALGSGWLLVADGSVLRNANRTVDTLVRTQYSARDYQTFLDEILGNVKKRFGVDLFNDFVASNYGQMLIRYLSAALDTLSWNLDQRSTETYIVLAALRSSVAREARALGYKPGRAVPASVDLVLSLPDGPYAFDVPVDAGFQFNGPDGTIWEQVGNVTIPAGQTTTSVVAPSGVGYRQGETRTETFSSSGLANQRFELRQVGTGREIAMGSVEVFVGNDEWTESDFLPFDTVNQFEVVYDLAPPALRFGDGVLGNIPPIGAQIVASYFATRGRSGNSAPANSIATPRSVLTVNFQDIPIEASHGTTSSGGENAEDVRSIKANAPMVFATADRAVSQPDWDTLLNAFRDSVAGAVARGRAEIIRGVENDVTIQNQLQAIKDAAVGGTELADLGTDVADIALLTSQIVSFIVSATSTVSNVSGFVNTGKSQIDSITDAVAAVSTDVSALKSMLSTLGYQQNIGITNGIGAVFASTLTKLPATPGTVSVFLDPLTTHQTTTASVTRSDGRCQTVFNGWDTSDAGRLVKLNGVYRRIQKVIAGDTFEYAGPPFTITSGDLVMSYNKEIQGFDDGSGTIAGTGITTGSVNYTTGAVSVTFAAVPNGTDLFGKPIVCSYQYTDSGLASDCDGLSASLSAVEASIDGMVPSVFTPISDACASLNSVFGSINARCASISTEIASANVRMSALAQVSANVAAEVDALEEYLDEHLSGDCKANIVQLRTLVHDANGDFAAPSTLLLDRLKTYFNARKIITVTVSAVSGIRDLLKANLSIKLEIEPNDIYSNVQPKVDSALDTVLKDRDYNENLLENDLYRLIVPKNDGSGGVKNVKSANIRITSASWADPTRTDPPPQPNADGDLVVPSGVIIVRGTVTFSEIKARLIG